MVRRHIGTVLGSMAATTVGLAALIALSFPVAVQLQNRALDDCTVHVGDRGTVTVHWKLMPPHHVCAVNGVEVKHLPPIR